MFCFRVMILFAIAALVVGACTSDAPPDRPLGPGNEGGASGAGGIGGGTGGGTPPIPPIVTLDGGKDAPPIPVKGSIISDLPSPLQVAGQPVAVRFQLLLESGPATRVTWSVDDTRIGSIGDDGVFHANGQVGGVVTVTAMLANSKFTTQYTVNVDITENPGGLSPADQSVLKAGGSKDAAFRWLYPYDGTVFPRGLAAPILQFGGAAASATYLAIKLPYYSYQQFTAGGTPIRATIPEAIWRGITLTASAADSVEVSLTKRSGSDVSGPV